MTRKSSIALWMIVALLVGLPLSGGLIHLLTESWWFSSVGYAPVFWKSLFWEGLLGSVIGTVFLVTLGFHYGLSQRLTRDRALRIFEYTEWARYSELLVKSVSLFFIGFIAFVAAINTGASWLTVQQFIHAQPFGKTDPIFAKDIGFYLFRLPFWDGLRQILLMLSIWSLVLTGTIYSLKGVFILPLKNWSRSIQIHLTLLVTAIIAIVGWGFLLDRYHLINQNSGVVYGVGYTDAYARILGLNAMSLLALILTIFLLITLGRIRQRLLWTLLVLFSLAWIVLLGLYPWGVQQFIVRPNELVKEKPFLVHNIQGTQDAYQLSDIQTRSFDVNANLTAQDLDNNQATLKNVRLWDYRPLLKTYRQLQEIRSYYRFHDVDVDRYSIGNQVQQVMLSARELEPNQLPPQAKNWVNQQLKYTHGHGLVMSPVNTVTTDGLPDFFIQDIPPKSSVDLSVNQPNVYYGELTQSYVFTGTTTDEFDYPQGGENAFTRYNGQGGVPMGTWGRKLAYAMDLQNFQILISNYFGADSKIHYHRSVLDRVKQIAPFLHYDQDPYLVLADGKLQWIVDAYTVSDRYPYSEPSQIRLPGATSEINLASGEINYIRNAVKVIVDAYDGTVQFCLMDPTDPIAQTYQSIFPQLFTSKDQVSPEVQAHFRYPEDLFHIQTRQYLTYHMTDPDVYYNREDLWQLPQQIYEDQPILVEPYYIIMRLPDQKESEFILIQPFTPNQKDNMIAWMAARSDGESYGSLIQYNFPKQSLVFGPRQIEARIDQDPTISQQLTLWSQSGSKVIRGNLIILPLEQSLLYVEPIYLRAEQAELPELKRVVVAYDKQVIMAKTFDEALQEIFGSKSSRIDGEAPPNSAQPPISRESSNLAQDALDTHEQADAAARQGDWARFGQLQQKLRDQLKRLVQNKS